VEFRWIEWNRGKVATHGVSETEAEYVVEHARARYPRLRADRKLLVWGATGAGRPIQVVYVLDPDDTVFVIHARPLTQREKSRHRRQRRRKGQGGA
jgi:uncharacterized DUF497 family protein